MSLNALNTLLKHPKNTIFANYGVFKELKTILRRIKMFDIGDNLTKVLIDFSDSACWIVFWYCAFGGAIKNVLKNVTFKEASIKEDEGCNNHE